MREAIGLAAAGRGGVEPNPRVGALALRLGWRLFRGHQSIWVVSKGAFVLAGILNAIWLIRALPHWIDAGLVVHALVVIVGNLCFLVGGIWLIVRNSRCPSFSTNYAFHWAFALWLIWYSFPHFGEII